MRIGSTHPSRLFLLLALGILASITLVSGHASAEFYLGGQVGGTFPNDFSEVKGVGIASGITSSVVSTK